MILPQYCFTLVCTETHFVSSQDDPRLKVPVQMRRRVSLDPTDLGPLPVRVMMMMSLLMSSFNQQRLRVCVVSYSPVGRRGFTVMGESSTSITVSGENDPSLLSGKYLFQTLVVFYSRLF